MKTHDSYEVVAESVTVLADVEQTFTLTAPTGKNPVAAGWNDGTATEHPTFILGYPDGADWHFKFKGASTDVGLELYLSCADL